jgi:hypothetical protein
LRTDQRGDVRSPHRRTAWSLRRDRLCEHVVLHGLSLDEIRPLVGDEELPEPLARALLHETESNPFFVSDVLKHLAEEGRIGWKRGSAHAILPTRQSRESPAPHRR